MATNNEKLTPFFYINMLNSGVKGEVVVDDKVYNQFLINRAFSLHIDTIAIVNEINKYGKISNQMHFDFLRYMITPRKRFSKWPKPKDHGDATIIAKRFNLTISKAYDLVGLFSKEEIKQFEDDMKAIEQ